MSSFMYGRYQGVADVAAARGGDPQVVTVDATTGNAVRDPKDNKLKPIDFAGIGGAKVLALVPAEALALHTFVTNPDNLKGFGPTIEHHIFAILLVATGVLYFWARLTKGHFLSIYKAFKDPDTARIRKQMYIVGELARQFAPVLAIAAWLMASQTTIGKQADWPDWDLPGVNLSGVGVVAWGTLWALVAFVLSILGDAIGFKVAPSARAKVLVNARAAVGNLPGGLPASDEDLAGA